MIATITAAAVATVEAAGAAGGIDEVRRLAERGWPASRALEGDSPELRAAIQAEARAVVESVDACEMVQLSAGTTIRDVYADFAGRLGDAAPVRTLEELREVIHAAGLRYEDCDRLSVSLSWACGEDVPATVTVEA
jgi:hypothetical protein